MCDITGRGPICSGLQVGLTDMQEQPLSEHIPPSRARRGAEERLNFNDGGIYLLFWQGPCVTASVARSRKRLKPPRVREGCRKTELDDAPESRGEEKVGNITRVCPRRQQASPRSLAAGPASTAPVSKALITVSVVPISPSSPPASFARPRSTKIRISRVRAGRPAAGQRSRHTHTSVQRSASVASAARVGPDTCRRQK